MKKKSKNLNSKLFLFLLFIIVIAQFVLSKQVIHNFEGKCSMCHLVNEDGTVFEKLFIKQIDFQCLDCHNNLGLSHPTGMKPTMTMPTGFPLDSAGKTTCATCHKTHGEKAYLLNTLISGKAFCFLCHREGLKNLHGGTGTGAHSNRKYEIVDENFLADDLSIQCMSCHDSTLGKEARIGIGTWTHLQGGSHPIGVDYMNAYTNKGGFKHPSLLDSKIKLFNGKVGCGTCHNIYSKERDQLVMSNKGSVLCLECHRK